MAALKLELIRHHFWHLTLTPYAENYARRKGRTQMPEAVRHRLEKTIGSAFHPMQGRQTPRETSATANVIHYAQHATATCCRACLEEWHGISTDRDLSAEELDYLTQLALLYVYEKIPDLDAEGQKIPSQRVQERQMLPAGENHYAH